MFRGLLYDMLYSLDGVQLVILGIVYFPLSPCQLPSVYGDCLRSKSEIKKERVTFVF